LNLRMNRTILNISVLSFLHNTTRDNTPQDQQQKRQGCKHLTKSIF
jgi:hypothetical protein